MGEIPHELFSIAYINIGNSLYLFGGYADNLKINSLWKLDLDSLVWTSVNQKNAPLPRSAGRMVADGEERLILFGGKDQKNCALNDLHIFSIKDGEWLQCHNSLLYNAWITYVHFIHVYIIDLRLKT